ncbi:Transcription factor TFIIIB component B [Lobosporangium transversale]|uniref:Myb-like domain-containing protein n=1 Tax=Lobosporangium transversale TaxID=64571 RepID=A0A1Y2GSQ3_9FUNG|nr:hypothetical protein BCR41DRAFT_420752 [Lobosporangium transversale]KAF9905870.1 Transcription factor TFIIIB component B [Lobosporangium transversale]ORZ21822.1 hypothetical protein BCR41DRAFT_420752 [Lobosporangium transversale]|eukprot:XP_021883073.1 hypothetical protein BCR41DRAFT_420752 [Lobosporangium transversale]
MSGISTRIDKGQKRFAPTLKTRPNRNKTVVSEDGASTATPSITGSDAGSFGATLLAELDTENNLTTPTAATPRSSNTLFSPQQAQKETARRMSIATPAANSSNISTLTSTKANRSSGQTISVSTSQATTKPLSPSPPPSPSSDSVPSSSSAAAITQASSSIVAAPASSASLSQKPVKGGSIIHAPTAKRYSDAHDLDDYDGNSSIEVPSHISVRKRVKGKQIARPRSHTAVVISASRHHTADDADGTGDGIEGEDGEELMPDYSNMYMYEFTRDLGVGRRSKIYSEIQKALETKKKVDKKAQRIRDIRRMEGRGPSPPQESDDEVNDADDASNTGNTTDEQVKNEKMKRAKSENIAPKPPQTHKTLAPQVRVIDGRIELDMDSLTVDHAVVEANGHRGPLEYVEESSATKFVNSASFSKKIRSERWTEAETELFYEAISQWGTDFGIICRLFPSKTRIAVRNKYKREDRLNHNRLAAAMNKKAPIDLDNYSKMVQREFPEVDDLEAIKLPEDAEDNQELLAENASEEDYDDGGEEVIQNVQDEDDGEEIVGMIE